MSAVARPTTIQELFTRLEAAGWTHWSGVTNDPDIWSRSYALFEPRGDSAYGNHVAQVDLSGRRSDDRVRANLSQVGTERVRTVEGIARIWRALVRRDAQLGARP
jgi:hypothetical protein